MTSPLAGIMCATSGIWYSRISHHFGNIHIPDYSEYHVSSVRTQWINLSGSEGIIVSCLLISFDLPIFISLGTFRFSLSTSRTRLIFFIPTPDKFVRVQDDDFTRRNFVKFTLRMSPTLETFKISSIFDEFSSERRRDYGILAPEFRRFSIRILPSRSTNSDCHFRSNGTRALRERLRLAISFPANYPPVHQSSTTTGASALVGGGTRQPWAAAVGMVATVGMPATDLMPFHGLRAAERNCWLVNTRRSFLEEDRK